MSGPARRDAPDFDAAKAVRLARQGLSQTTIAQRTGWNRQVIREALREAGLVPPSTTIKESTP